MRRSFYNARPEEPVASLHLLVPIFTFKCFLPPLLITAVCSVCTLSHAKWLSTQHLPATPLLQTTFTLACHPRVCLPSAAFLASSVSLSLLPDIPCACPVCLCLCLWRTAAVHCSGAAVCPSVLLLCVALCGCRGVSRRRRPGLCMGVVMAFSTRRTSLPAKGSNLHTITTAGGTERESIKGRASILEQEKEWMASIISTATSRGTKGPRLPQCRH